jgi:hypothetical protein
MAIGTNLVSSNSQYLTDSLTQTQIGDPTGARRRPFLVPADQLSPLTSRQRTRQDPES